jgi:hypothetical protein
MVLCLSRLCFGIIEDLLRFRDIPASGNRRDMHFPIENLKADASGICIPGVHIRICHTKHSTG